MSMNTSSRVGQCVTVFSILTLFNYALNEGACLPVSSAYSPIMLSEAIYTLMRLHSLNENKINAVRGVDTVSRIEKLPAEHGLSC